MYIYVYIRREHRFGPSSCLFLLLAVSCEDMTFTIFRQTTTVLGATTTADSCRQVSCEAELVLAQLILSSVGTGVEHLISGIQC